MCRTRPRAGSGHGDFCARVGEAAGARDHILGAAEPPGCRHGCWGGLSKPHGVPSPALATASPSPSVLRLSPIVPLYCSSPFLASPPSAAARPLPWGFPATPTCQSRVPPFAPAVPGQPMWHLQHGCGHFGAAESPPGAIGTCQGVMGGPQHPPGMWGSPANLQLIASGENNFIRGRAYDEAKQQEGRSWRIPARCPTALSQ